MDPHEIGYDRTRTTQFYQELNTRIAALPGVQSASLSFGGPFVGLEYSANVYAENRVIPPGQQPPLIFHNVVDPRILNPAHTAASGAGLHGFRR